MTLTQRISKLEKKVTVQAWKGPPESQTFYQFSEAESAEVQAILVECGAVQVAGKEDSDVASR